MNIAIYIRVSTTKQDYEVQLQQLEEYCKKKEWTIVKIYKETASGKESERPVFKEMLKEAQSRLPIFNGILVWALDRFTREGSAKVWQYMNLLSKNNIQFISFQEPMLSTDNEMVRDIILTVMGAMAKQERIRISERTKAGLQRVKAKGIKLGRKEISNKTKEEIIRLSGEGKSIREISKIVHYWDKSNNRRFVSTGFVHSVLNRNISK